MRIILPTAVLLAVASAGAPTLAQGLDPVAPLGSTGCSDFGQAPTLAGCFAQRVAYGGGESGALASIACIVDRLNDWKLRQLACLQTAMAVREATVLWPWKALGEIDIAVPSVDTLRQEVERLACDWRFTPRTAAFRDLYRRPAKLCRDAFNALWGSHERFYDADRQELFGWTSVLTHNMIEDRTIHDYGRAGELPEETWSRIAIEGGKSVGASGSSPGEAARLGAQLQADKLRVDGNTIKLTAQTILVQQQARDLNALDRRRERALAAHFLGRLADIDGRVPPTPTFSGHQR